MLKDAQLTLQAALFTALSAVTYISTNSIPVKGTVPKGFLVPYITIGDMTVVNDSTQGVGLQTITLIVHTWDQGLDTTRLKLMMAAVLLGLDNTSLTLSDAAFTHISTSFLSSQVFNDPDGMTKHGVQR